MSICSLLQLTILSFKKIQGVEKATEAAKSSKAKIAVPLWSKERGEKDTDFNDLFKSEGPQSIRNCFEKAQGPLEEETHAEDPKVKAEYEDNEEDKSSIATKEPALPSSLPLST